jgi:hypothetical protein
MDHVVVTRAATTTTTIVGDRNISNSNSNSNISNSSKAAQLDAIQITRQYLSPPSISQQQSQHCPTAMINTNSNGSNDTNNKKDDLFATSELIRQCLLSYHNCYSAEDNIQPNGTSTSTAGSPHHHPRLPTDTDDHDQLLLNQILWQTTCRHDHLKGSNGSVVAVPPTVGETNTTNTITAQVPSTLSLPSLPSSSSSSVFSSITTPYHDLLQRLLPVMRSVQVVPSFSSSSSNCSDDRQNNNSTNLDRNSTLFNSMVWQPLNIMI